MSVKDNLRSTEHQMSISCRYENISICLPSWTVLLWKVLMNLPQTLLSTNTLLPITLFKDLVLQETNYWFWLAPGSESSSIEILLGLLALDPQAVWISDSESDNGIVTAHWPRSMLGPSTCWRCTRIRMTSQPLNLVIQWHFWFHFLLCLFLFSVSLGHYSSSPASVQGGYWKDKVFVIRLTMTAFDSRR